MSTTFSPIPGWLKRYPAKDFPADLIAGLTVAAMLVPQAMAYALLAGLPPVVGLYASTLPLIVYALIGTSRQLAVGPVAIVALLTFTGVSAIAAPGSPEFVGLAALLALMVGVFQLGLGLMRAGFIANFLSHAVVSGFTSAAAIVIGLSQVAALTGLSVKAHGTVPLLGGLAQNLGNVHLPTLAVGLSSIAALLLLRRFWPRVPGALVVVVLGVLLSQALGLPDMGVRVVGEVPGGLPGLALPGISLAALQALLPTALAITFVGFMESYAVGKSIATREGYAIRANRELSGLGGANLAAAAFSGFPVTGGFSRSAVNYQAGARSGMASIVTALLVLLTLLFFTGAFTFLPNAVLAAVVIVAVYGLIDAATPRHLFRLKPVDGWTLVLTFAATLLIGIEQGIVIGLVASLLLFIWRSAYPHTAELGYLPAEGVYRNVRRYPEAVRETGVYILRPDAALYFANAARLDGLVREAVAERGLRVVLLDFSGVNDIDAVGVETLEALERDLTARGVSLHIASMKGPVRDLVAKGHFGEDARRRMGWLSLDHAMRGLKSKGES